MDKNIFIVILIIVIIAIVGAFVFSGSDSSEGKVNTQITILSQDTQNGDQIEIELKDEKGTGLSGENVTITTEENENYPLVTDNSGKAFLTLDNGSSGQNYIKVKYNGSEKYNGCSFEQYA